MTTIDILLHENAGFAAMHAAGFAQYRRSLTRELGVSSRLGVYSSGRDLRDRLTASDADVALVISDWSAPADWMCETFASARRTRPDRRLVYFDIFDQTSSPYFAVLPEVDVYVKSKMLTPVDRYQESLAGGYVFADFCQKRLGWDLKGWRFGSVPDPAHAGKIVQGWNFAVSRRCRLLLRLNRLAPSRLEGRPIELHARITPPARAAREWYEEYRALACDAVRPLRSHLRVTSPERVSQWRYLAELRRCRLVFSPFGWGEVCLRDYEAVSSGCVLIKPDMSHVATSPDIFVAGETYVPVRWDLSDLGEVCDALLRDPARARAIATNAQDRLHTYLERGGFVGDVRRMLDRAGVVVPPPRVG